MSQPTKRCPDCESPDIEQTTIGFLDGLDRNPATCGDCGWRGLSCECEWLGPFLTLHPHGFLARVEIATGRGLDRLGERLRLIRDPSPRYPRRSRMSCGISSFVEYCPRGPERRIHAR